MSLQWFRMYTELVSDPKVQLLAFEDQRHFVMLLCLKGNGTLDSKAVSAQHFDQMICKALGLGLSSGMEAKRRLMEVGLIDDAWQPIKWDERQYDSDSSTARTRKWRDKQRSKKEETSRERHGNVTVTPQSRIDTEQIQNRTEALCAREAPEAPPAALSDEKKPTPEAEAALALRAEGVQTTCQDVVLIRWVSDGFTIAQMLQATQLARMRKPYPEPIRSAYLDAILRDDKRMAPKQSGPKVISMSDRVAWTPEGDETDGEVIRVRN